MVNRIKNSIKNMRIFNKMFLSCLIVTMAISLLAGGITYRIASVIILEKTIRQSEETIRQVSDNYDSFMKLIYNKLDYLAFNPTLQEGLVKEEITGVGEDGYYSAPRKIKRLLVQMFNSIHMEDIEIYGNEGQDYYCAVGQFHPALPNEEELKKAAREAKGRIVCINDVQGSGNIQVVKEIRDILSMQPLGILRLSIKLPALERTAQNVDFASDGTILLLDDRNQIIIGADSELTRRADELFTNWEDAFRYEIGGNDYQVVYRISEYTGWKTVGILPDKEISKAIMPLQAGTLVTMLCGIMLSLLLSAGMTYLMVRPIMGTVGALNRFSKGDFSVRLEAGRKDEFGEMNVVFNSTIERVEQLLEEISHSRLLNKEMEFKALQAQINPHFLYNALDTVNWMARKKGEDEICEMISAVSSLLRISISNKETVFTVEKELRYVKDYLYIQKTRYGNRFEADYRIDETVLQQQLPKLTLQPLVENAIVHSVEVSKEKTFLTIEGYSEGDEVVLRVSDTGVGMPEEALRNILKEPAEGDREANGSAHTGLGIHAVDKRLKYMFGEQYGLFVESREWEGTSVTVRIPYQV